MGFLGFIGRSQQFEETLAGTRSRLLRIAFSWSHDKALADDLVQETLTKALGRHGQLRDQAALHSWLYSILVNCWHDHLRRRKPIESMDTCIEEEYFCEDESLGPDKLCMQNQIIQNVRNAIDKLPIGQREVISMVDLEECSYAEVAAILQIPIGTVMSRLSRARAALRAALCDDAHAPAAAFARPTAQTATATVHSLRA